MWYIREQYGGTEAVATIARMFISPWLIMLALGALGHRTGHHIFYQQYWTVFLTFAVARLYVGHSPISKWRASQNPKELK